MIINGLIIFLFQNSVKNEEVIGVLTLQHSVLNALHAPILFDAFHVGTHLLSSRSDSIPAV